MAMLRQIHVPLRQREHLAPKLMATLLSLRQRLIVERGITTAAEMMLVDLAVLSYYVPAISSRWSPPAA
jgi:hypothetical protein